MSQEWKGKRKKFFVVDLLLFLSDLFSPPPLLPVHHQLAQLGYPNEANDEGNSRKYPLVWGQWANCKLAQQVVTHTVSSERTLISHWRLRWLICWLMWMPFSLTLAVCWIFKYPHTQAVLVVLYFHHYQSLIWPKTFGGNGGDRNRLRWH